jgi:mono/diheme cytochrome c family protein
MPISVCTLSARVATGLVLLCLSIVAARAQNGASTAAPNNDSPGYGLYMSRAADCMPCHTRPGGSPFAGGLQINTPFGMLTSPNITPDPDTGIGGWTDQQFYRAVHDGIGHKGQLLYPVMPYTSYAKMTREDVLAIKKYLFSLKPVFAPRAPSAMDFPFDIRKAMLVWRALYFHPGVFTGNPRHSADWNRGAYLVEGPGHCGQCHSPRNLLGASEQSDSLAGGIVDRWLAPNISSDPVAGVGDRPVEQIVDFLKTGANRSMGVAFGPMAEVVHDSLRYLTEADLRSVAVYLKEGPDRSEPAQTAVATAAGLRRGAALYLDNCAQCHQDSGTGVSGFVPNLAGNAVVNEFGPHDMIVVMLSGLQGSGGYGVMPGFAGALSDRQVADIANYVRVSWGNRGVADVTPSMVASLRSAAGVGAAGSEAARAFDCPAIGAAPVPNTIATPVDVQALAAGGDYDMENKISSLIAQIRAQQPGISNAALSNIMIASFCPVVANESSLNQAQKRARLMNFNMTLQDQLASALDPAGVRVLATVPLPPSLMQQIGQIASEHHQTPAEWMAETLAHQIESRQ